MSERLTVSNVSKCVKMNKSITQKRLKTKCIYIYNMYIVYIYFRWSSFVKYHQILLSMRLCTIFFSIECLCGWFG